MEPFSDPKPRVSFEVEKIIGMSSDGCFQVRWAPVWVSKFHLVGCEHLIKEFLEDTAVEENNDESENSDGPVELSGIELSWSENSTACELNASGQQPQSLESDMNEGNMSCHSSSSILGMGVKKSDEHFINDIEEDFESFPSIPNIKTEDADMDFGNDMVSLLPSMRRLPNQTESDNDGDCGTTLDISPALTYVDETAKSTETCAMKNQFVLPSLSKGDKRNICSVCKKECPTPSLLAIHFRKHSGEKPYQCSYCGSKFSQKFSWKRHLRIHTGEKPFSCNFCKYSCARKDDLKTHMRTHRNGKDSYICAVCGEQYKTSNQLEIHLSSHSTEKPYT